jgi:hypothetical protein
MSYSPDDSRIKLTAEQEAHVATLDPESMKSYFRDLAVSAGYVSRDLDPNCLIENEGVESKSAQFTKRMTINGKTVEFAADTELAVEQQATEYLKSLQASREEEIPATRQATVETESAEQVQNRVELELAFKRGTLSAKEYIEQSGVLDGYLRDHGVSIESLQSASATHFEQSWKSATDEWMATPEGQSWIGGEQNMQTIGEIIAKFNLTDQPSAETLSRAVQYAKENNLLVSNPEVDRNRAISEATTPEQLRAALGRGPSFDSIYGNR